MAVQAPQTVGDFLGIIGRLHEGFEDIQKRYGVFDEGFRRYDWAQDRMPEIGDLEERYERLQGGVRYELFRITSTWKSLIRLDAQGRRGRKNDEVLDQADNDYYVQFAQSTEKSLRDFQAAEKGLKAEFDQLVVRLHPFGPNMVPSQESRNPEPPRPPRDGSNRSMQGFGIPGGKPHMQRGEMWQAGVNRRR